MYTLLYLTQKVNVLIAHADCTIGSILTAGKVISIDRITGECATSQVAVLHTFVHCSGGNTNLHVRFAASKSARVVL